MSERVWRLVGDADGRITVQGPPLTGTVLVYERPDPAQNRQGPHSQGSETSKQAALDNFPRSGSQRRRVLDAVVAAGDWGKTREELAIDLGLPDSGTDARVWELKRGGFVVDTERTRRTRLGEPAAVLVATAKGRDEPEPATPDLDPKGALFNQPTIVPKRSSAYDPTSDWA